VSDSGGGVGLVTLLLGDYPAKQGLLSEVLCTGLHIAVIREAGGLLLIFEETGDYLRRRILRISR